MKIECSRSHRLLLIAGQVALTVSVGAWYLLPAQPGIVRPTHVDYRGRNQSLALTDSLQEITSTTDFERTIGKLISYRPEIDFEREKLVRVHWVDHGPLNARLDFRTRRLSHAVVFFVTKPSSNYSTFSEQLNEDWYAVPGAWQVALVSRRSIFMADAAILLFVLAQVGIAVFILAGQRGRVRRLLSVGPQVPGRQSLPAGTS